MAAKSQCKHLYGNCISTHALFSWICISQVNISWILVTVYIRGSKELMRSEEQKQECCENIKDVVTGVPVMVQPKRIWLGDMRLRVRSLVSLSGLRIWRCCELWCRSQMRLRSSIVWLWCRPAATAPIRDLAWEPPQAVGVALKKRQKTKKKKNLWREFWEVHRVGSTRNLSDINILEL